MEAWIILLPALVLCALMILTHTYLGLHVLARGIIFIDLALAQIAALGVCIAFLMGEEAHGLLSQLYALTATLLAALGFAALRRVPGKVNREVIIGCIYVVTMALSIVILSRSSQGMEELKSLFNGNILWTSWEDIGLVALVYGVLMLFHLIYGRQFYALSFTDKSTAPGYLWEFLFFASFSIVITLAVNLAGVLLVFAFLIIPAFSASLLSDKFSLRLILAWGIGMCGACLGLVISYLADLPVGATVVVAIGVLPLFTLAIARLKN
ncbi:MAG: metal ABC transporter permease [Gammaproteobacteria bacterium]|nr:metal ABC transporter permease [Gammaproteobacteria bacterium]